MFLLTRTAREQARELAITAAYARAWKYEEAGLPGITFVNTLVFASLYTRGTLHLTLLTAVLLVLAADAHGAAPPVLIAQALALLLLIAAVVVPLIAGYRTAREVDEQPFLPPE